MGEATPKFQRGISAGSGWDPQRAQSRRWVGSVRNQHLQGRDPWICPLCRLRAAPGWGWKCPGWIWRLRIHQQGAQTAAVPWAELFPHRFLQPREFCPKNILKKNLHFPGCSAAPGENPEPILCLLECLALGVSTWKIPFFGNALSCAVPPNLFLGSSTWSVL